MLNFSENNRSSAIQLIGITRFRDAIALSRERLPDDLLGKDIPEGTITSSELSNFVRQLLLIGISAARLRLAQEDHYRAFTQRSQWVKEQLLGFDEEIKYEGRLVEGWRERFLIMKEGVPSGCDEATLILHGLKLYEWIVTEAPSKSQLWFRPDFQSEYMTKGSYHLLADKPKPRVGWHPEYETRLVPPVPPVPPPSPSPKRARKRKGVSK